MSDKEVTEKGERGESRPAPTPAPTPVREDPAELLRRAAELLENKRGNHAKTYQSVAEQARALAERLERY